MGMSNDASRVRRHARRPAFASTSASAAVISSLTPPRADVLLDVKPGPAGEVTLLPTVLGKGGFGRVVEGMYQGHLVGVKLILDLSLDTWGLSADAATATAKLAQGAKTGGCLASDDQAAAKRNLEDAAAALAQEVTVLSRCHHPNIVNLLAACLVPPRLCLVMERCETSLDKLLYGRPGQLLPME
ncbi:hypothetical protein GPECTOR_13g843 [Gonium pectorale]|uniref:Protein kinase domain-containing protein n=1 Tax=Gonium pectorale TaxID=33097 RepID=A0A150GNK7_GONPE|nr:hypothetical protein GPECTOR_13g843 [Gonium pectorale]|eukprot:KXZ51355.1 hypothetical protein GPECTOR_13g843 [Gonium pectorale]